MNELANEPNVNGGTNRVSMPGRLRGALVVLVFQVLANGFLGWLIIQGLNDDAAHGETDSGAGLGYTIGYVSVALAVVLLVCVVGTFRPLNWVRPVIITIESIAIINGVVNVVNGQVSGLLGIVLAVVTIAILVNDEVRDWYRYGREQ
jgi:hypothetical protein